MIIFWHIIDVELFAAEFRERVTELQGTNSFVARLAGPDVGCTNIELSWGKTR